MKNKILLYGRFLLAFTVLILCCLAFWGNFYPLKVLDLQFVSSLQNGLVSGFGVSVILLLLTVFLTLLFGRVYCNALSAWSLSGNFDDFI